MSDLAANKYDAIIVGSSPLLLIEAIRLTEDGQSVLVIEKDSRIGGVWKTVRIDSGQQVETACHLIEPYKKVYQDLEYYSGVKFEKLSPKPLRVSNSGTRTLYSSRWIMARHFLKSCVTVLICQLREAIQGLTRSARQSSTLIDKKRIHLQRINAFLKHRASMYWKGVDVCGPRTGFGAFIAGLHSRAIELKVAFEFAKVNELERLDNVWRVRCKDATYFSDRVIVSQSLDLTQVGSHKFASIDSPTAQVANLLFEIDLKLCVDLVPYAFLPKHKTVKRLARVVSGEAKYSRISNLYLVQINESNPAVISGEELEMYRLHAQEALQLAGVIRSVDDAVFRKVIVGSYLSSSELTNFQPCVNDNGLSILPTLNDLALSMLD